MTDYEQAPCYGQPTEIFYDTKLYFQVKKIFCSNCPLIEQCLQDCLIAEEEEVDSKHYRSGVFGGMSPTERNKHCETGYIVLSDDWMERNDNSNSN